MCNYVHIYVYHMVLLHGSAIFYMCILWLKVTIKNALLQRAQGHSQQTGAALQIKCSSKSCNTSWIFASISLFVVTRQYFMHRELLGIHTYTGSPISRQPHREQPTVRHTEQGTCILCGIRIIVLPKRCVHSTDFFWFIDQKRGWNLSNCRSSPSVETPGGMSATSHCLKWTEWPLQSVRKGIQLVCQKFTAKMERIA